jgi:hypothetical protein
MASDQGLQRIIGAALIDRRVLASLMANPLSLADQFELTVPERRFVVTARARDLLHFAALVESWTNGFPPRQKESSGRPERELARQPA